MHFFAFFAEYKSFAYPLRLIGVFFPLFSGLFPAFFLVVFAFVLAFFAFVGLSAALSGSLSACTGRLNSYPPAEKRLRQGEEKRRCDYGDFGAVRA